MWDFLRVRTTKVLYVLLTFHLHNSSVALHLIHVGLEGSLFHAFLCPQDMEVTWKGCSIVSAMVSETGSCSSDIREAKGLEHSE